jgi:hypothetical protein
MNRFRKSVTAALAAVSLGVAIAAPTPAAAWCNAWGCGGGGINGGALAAGVIGGLALGAMAGAAASQAQPSYGYGAYGGYGGGGGWCRQRVYDDWGRFAGYRRVPC